MKTSAILALLAVACRAATTPINGPLQRSALLVEEVATASDTEYDSVDTVKRFHITTVKPLKARDAKPAASFEDEIVATHTLSTRDSFESFLAAQDQIIPIPTLLPRQSRRDGVQGIHKRQNADKNYGWYNQEHGGQFLLEPSNEQMWCETIDASKGLMLEAKVRNGSVCFFYQTPCDPKDNATYLVGYEGEFNATFQHGSNYTGYGCRNL